MLGNAVCKAEDEYASKYRTFIRGEYLARGSRPYSSLYTYYPSYRSDEIKKPHASDMFLIEGGVYGPHDPDDTYSTHRSHGGYGNNYAEYSPYHLGGYYSNWQGSESIGSESAASVPSEDDKDYNDDGELAERRRTGPNIRKRK